MQEPVVLEIGNGAQRHCYACIWTVTGSWQSVWTKLAGVQHGVTGGVFFFPSAAFGMF